MPAKIQSPSAAGLAISAILPNFNHGRTLEAAVTALATQSLAPDEIIVVDDGSTDDSRARLNELEQRFATLRTVLLEQNGGAIGALNRGLAEARGRYVYFGAADDVVLPGLFAALAPLLEGAPDAAFASCEARVVDVETGRVAMRPPVLPAFCARTFTPGDAATLFKRIDNFVLTGAALVRRDMLLEVGGFDPALGAMADGMALRALAFRRGFAFVPHVGVEWRLSLRGVSRTQTADPEANSAALLAALARMRGDPAFPEWYPALFERRWRFAVGRLCAKERPLDPLRLAALAGGAWWSEIAFRVSSRIGGRAGEFAALAWLTLRERPMSIGRLALTRLWRARRSRGTPILAAAEAPVAPQCGPVARSKAAGEWRNGMAQSNLDVEAVKAQVVAGHAERDTVMRLVGELLRDKRPIPPEIELFTLSAHVSDDPTRLDLKRRMVTLLGRLGRPVPPELAEEIRSTYVTEEHGTDFQAMLAEYAAKVGVSDLPPEFFDDLAQARRFTMTTVERLYGLWDAVQYLVRAPVEGAIVEAGVWRGGSMMIAALAAARAGDTDRELWLYDTFAGLPRPDPELDVDILGNRAIDGWEPRNVGGEETYWAYADESDVRTNMARTGYPTERMRFVKGMVEQTIPANGPERIALLRIDTDWYHSYKHILDHFYDRVVPGGVVLFDDYGHFQGARRAVDEFRAARGIVSPLLRVDFSCRMMLKL